MKTFLIIFITILLMLCGFMSFYIFLDAKNIIAVNLPEPVICSQLPEIPQANNELSVQEVLSHNFNTNVPKSLTTNSMKF